MAGTYIEGVSKVLSGVYTIIKAAVSGISQGARGTVAYPFTASWGPVNELTPISTKPEFQKAFGKTLTATKIAEHAFRGRPQKVLAYRMAIASAAKGIASLTDSGAAKSIELETLYPSSRGFTAVVKDGVTVGTLVIDIMEGGVLLASVKGTTLNQLVDELNKTDYVRVKTKGTNLPKVIAGVAFTGGSDGSPVTSTAYEAFLDAVEADGRANSFALDAVTDPSIITLAKEWTLRVRDAGLYISFVSGGALSWDADTPTANAASKAFNHRAILNVGNGVDGYPASEMAIFVAARAASVALNRTLTDEVTGYQKVNKKLTPTQRVVAKEAGTIIFVQDGDTVVIDEGINTLTTPGPDESRELGKVRVNNALDHIARDTEKFGDEYKKSRSNTQEARETFAATLETDYFAPLAAMEVIQQGFFYRPDPEYHGKDAVFNAKIDEAFFHCEITPVDSMEKIYQKVGVRF